MKDLQTVVLTLEHTFKNILQNQMQGIPILNPAIKVEAVGFHYHEGRILGVMITPWLMNVVMLPKSDEDWSQMELGNKQPHRFPSKTYKFMVNDIEGIGPCQTHSLYSPMREFASHAQAVRVAEQFLDALMEEREPTEEDLVDEELLGRILRGEEGLDVALDGFSEQGLSQAGAAPVRGLAEPGVRVEKTLSRRELLGGVRKDA